METTFDIIVIGSGPGGYIAAIRSAQLGYHVALVEKYNTLGGTCTNVSCIPSKALLDSTENYHSAQTKFAAQGIEIKEMQLNFQQLMQRKNEVVKQNVSATDDDLFRMPYAHPTYSETLKEAYLMSSGQGALNI